MPAQDVQLPHRDGTVWGTADPFGSAEHQGDGDGPQAATMSDVSDEELSDHHATLPPDWVPTPPPQDRTAEARKCKYPHWDCKD